MQIEEKKCGAVTVLRPDGPMVGEDAETVKGRLRVAIRQNLGRVILDLTEVPFADSRALEVLVEVNEELGTCGQTLKLCQLNDTVREVLDLTGLGNQFEQYDEVNAGVRSFL